MATASSAPWQAGKGCVILRVWVTPKSSRDAVEGVEPTADGPAVRIRVRAVPANGEANAAVGSLLAGWLNVAESRVRLYSGAKSRVKSFAVAGDVDELALLLAASLDATAAKLGAKPPGAA